MIAIIDYGAGNLHSVKNALDFIGASSIITDDIKVIKAADGIILPGVGSFGDAIDSMQKNGLTDTVKSQAAGGKPFLGICLGLQLLFESSDESPGVEGLGILKGTINKIPKNSGLKVPHMGWNSIDIKQPNGIFENIEQDAYVYFVHSYYLKVANIGDVAATTNYGVEIDAAVQVDKLIATQFHPEKSGETGLKILRNFCKMSGEV